MTNLAFRGMTAGIALVGLAGAVGCSGDVESATSGGTTSTTTTTDSAGGGGAAGTSTSMDGGAGGLGGGGAGGSGAGGSGAGGGETGSTSGASTSSWTLSIAPDAEPTLLAELPSPHDLQLTATALFARTSEFAGKGLVRVDLASGDVTTVLEPVTGFNAYSVVGDTVFFAQAPADCAACSPGFGGVLAVPETGGEPQLVAELPDWAPQSMAAGEQGLYLPDGTGALHRLPLDGGAPEIVVAAAVTPLIATDETGVYYMSPWQIHHLNEASLEVTDVPSSGDGAVQLRARGGYAYWLESYPARLWRSKPGGPAEQVLSVPDVANRFAVNDTHAFVSRFDPPGDPDYPFGGLAGVALGSGEPWGVGNIYQPGDVAANATHVFWISYTGIGQIWRAKAP